MRTLDEITATARPKVVFSNGSEFDCFVDKQCARCQIDYNDCPLIDAAFLGFHPEEWIPNDTQARYRCKARVPLPKGELSPPVVRARMTSS